MLVEVIFLAVEDSLNLLKLNFSPMMIVMREKGPNNSVTFQARLFSKKSVWLIILKKKVVCASKKKVCAAHIAHFTAHAIAVMVAPVRPMTSQSSLFQFP